MTSTPKQHEGDASVAANGSLSPLEQTVMGMAPPPRPAAASAPAHEPAGMLVPSAIAASAPPALDTAPAGPPPSAMLIAAPTIAVSEAPAQPAPGESRSASAAVARQPASAEDGAAASGAPLGATLRIEPGKPAVLAPPRPAASERAERAAPSERTALSADYLREARAAALDQVAQRPPPAAPLVLATTERAPMAEVAVASALPSVGDTHRSVAPALEPEPASIAGVAPPSGVAAARGFEPVPVVRAPLAESLSSALGPLAELGGGTRNLLPPSSRPRPVAPRERESGAGRWLLLAAVALVTVGVVSVGGRVWHRYRNPGARQRAIATVEAGAPTPAATSRTDGPAASHALLANRPAPEPASGARVSVVSATAAAPASAPGVSASPESQLAATAGRYVLSGNYAEALPLYRQLERSWPENTAYAAMARLLEKKVGSHNDTRTVTPAAAP